ncbi:MAG: M15 family metallopeptidase [Propionivibrio sp.]
MNALTVACFVLGVGCLCSLLGWVGWRHFLASESMMRAAAIAAKAPDFGGRTALRRVGPGDLQSKSSPVSKTLGLAFSAVLLVGGLVIGGVFAMADRIAPESLAVLEWERQAHIQGVLNPEQLVPPPALPPDLFVSSERPALETADRDWNKLNPEFMHPVLQVFARLAARGYTFALLEGYRSPERQEKLADLGSQVTNARSFQSKHQYGMAADLAPVRDGKLVISERDPWAMEAYLALGEEAEKLGLTWGGRWWFKDYGHVEMAGSVAAMARSMR